MTVGDLVIVLDDPLMYGPGIIREINRDGRLHVEFEPDDDDPHGPRGLFAAHELELLAVWMQAA